MKIELKTWGTLGLATALAGAGLAGCSGEAGDSGEGGESAQTAQSGEMGEGEGGEGGEGSGGEGGEGGVDTAAAASDPVAYQSALGVAEAHVIAARDAFAVGKTDAAAEMFAHPVSEVLLEMDPVFAELGVEDFKPLFSDASQAVLAGEDEAAINAKYDGIIAALRAAGEKAPDDGSSASAVAGAVVADQIERAVAMYARANEDDAYEPYLDGYGYYKAAQATFEGASDAIQAENERLHDRITAALDMLGQAYPGAERPARLDVEQGALSGASASVLLAAS